eukprot:COSAG02_NODE_1033_length_15063_cov_14.987503_2_plen_151_part_00
MCTTKSFSLVRPHPGTSYARYQSLTNCFVVVLLALDRTWHEMSSPQKNAARTLGFTQDDFMQDLHLEAGHEHEPVDAALLWNNFAGRLLRSGRSVGGAGDGLSSSRYSSTQNSSLGSPGSLSSLLSDESATIDFDGDSDFPRGALLFDSP